MFYIHFSHSLHANITKDWRTQLQKIIMRIKLMSSHKVDVLTCTAVSWDTWRHYTERTWDKKPIKTFDLNILSGYSPWLMDFHEILRKVLSNYIASSLKLTAMLGNNTMRNIWLHSESLLAASLAHACIFNY